MTRITNPIINPLWLYTVILMIGFCFFPSQGHGQVVNMTPAGGYYQQAPVVCMSCNTAGLRIFYSTNGHTPDTTDHLYTGSLTLDSTLFSTSDIYRITISPEDFMYIPPEGVKKTVVLRAAAFDDTGQRVGEICTQTYLVKELGCDSLDLPVISICADSADLFDFYTGIMVPGYWYDSNNVGYSGNYHQSGREWERKVNIELLLPEGGGFNQFAGLRIHGGNTRNYPQKPFKIYARDEYGSKYFSCRVFQDLPFTQYEKLVFRPFQCPWKSNGVNNYIATKLASKLNIDVSAIRPAILYLNGEYWGIYFIHEKTDEHFLKAHYGHKKDNYNIIDNWWELKNGTIENFDFLMSFIQENDLSKDSIYQKANHLIDIDNFIDYQIFEIFICNEDWPGNNTRFWQYKDGPWRWIFHDGDISLYNFLYDAYANATSTEVDQWSNKESATLLFRKLLLNKNFRQKFLDRYIFICKTHLDYSQTLPIWKNIYSMLEIEVGDQIQRFGSLKDIIHWQDYMYSIERFLQVRAAYALSEIGISSSLDIDKKNIVEQQCFPNPSSGEFILHLIVFGEQQQNITIYDLSGRQRYSSRVLCHNGDNYIPLSVDLPTGIYIVSTNDKNFKLVIAR